VAHGHHRAGVAKDPSAFGLRMNHLAHLFLAQETAESLIGNLAGDFVKGALGDRFPPAIAEPLVTTMQGNVNDYAGSTWIAQKAERDYMFSAGLPANIHPDEYAALKNSKTTIITSADYDVFGDGRVVIKSAPGHSPDHQVLFVNLTGTGPVLLSGDLYHYPEERMLKKIPTTEFDREQSAASRAAIEAFLMRTHAQLWIEHDFTANAKLTKSPAYYD
jgi:glyoxylase-like metal-dependent hydrolase (beta-lactamase superfamily II)